MGRGRRAGQRRTARAARSGLILGWASGARGPHDARGRAPYPHTRDRPAAAHAAERRPRPAAPQASAARGGVRGPQGLGGARGTVKGSDSTMAAAAAAAAAPPRQRRSPAAQRGRSPPTPTRLRFGQGRHGGQQLGQWGQQQQRQHGRRQRPLAAAAAGAAGGSDARQHEAEQQTEQTRDHANDVALAHLKESGESVGRTWMALQRWEARRARRAEQTAADHALSKTAKVVVFGGGSFGTAIASHLAWNKPGMEVTMLVRDPAVVEGVNESHRNPRYLSHHELPEAVNATTCAADALAGAEVAFLVVPVQRTRQFLDGLKVRCWRRVARGRARPQRVRLRERVPPALTASLRRASATPQDILPPDLPIVALSKGLELGTNLVLADVIKETLGKRQPLAVLSGPTFASEMIDQRPTAMVCASRDRKVSLRVQQLLASDYLRVNTSDDVVGAELCGALKNVLAIAAGIVEGLELGNNSMAALVAQGMSEIRWLAERMGARPATLAGPAGVGDVMLTCFVPLSRNRTVGVRLGSGESVEDILGSMKEVAEGVPTAAAVVELARKHNVQLPVLTAVAYILAGKITPRKAVLELMKLPQIEER